ncbi:hypothetical protein FO519_006511 [Halicephalobus sp. NKZ332]|nr:hypothetical protein FO519_006511 [Halicephalobus sp. NKZ332]
MKVLLFVVIFMLGCEAGILGPKNVEEKPENSMPGLSAQSDTKTSSWWQASSDGRTSARNRNSTYTWITSSRLQHHVHLPIQGGGQPRDGGQHNVPLPIQDGGQLRDGGRLQIGGQLKDGGHLRNGGRHHVPLPIQGGGQLRDGGHLQIGGRHHVPLPIQDGGQPKDGGQLQDGGHLQARLMSAPMDH